eukprot:1657968-Rhodomonas_salina.1
MRSYVNSALIDITCRGLFWYKTEWLVPQRNVVDCRHFAPRTIQPSVGIPRSILPTPCSAPPHYAARI